MRCGELLLWLIIVSNNLKDMRYAKATAATDSDSASGASEPSETAVRATRRKKGPGRRRSTGGGRKPKRLKASRTSLLTPQPPNGEAILTKGVDSSSPEEKKSEDETPVLERVPPAHTGPPKDRYISLDCEMVGTLGNQSSLARCTILDYEGRVLFDEYVRPTQPILNYRTRWSGIRPADMKKAIPFTEAVQRIKAILDGTIIIGHDLAHDFRAIGLPHPKDRTRDTSKFPPLRNLAGLCTMQRPSLRNLTAALLGRSIQSGPHCSVEDARAALDIYRKYETLWEQHLMDKSYWLEDQFWPDDLLCC